MAVALAGRLNSGDEGKFMVNQLAGISIEALCLRQLPPDAPFDFLAGKTPTERTEELRQQKQFLSSLGQDLEAVLPRLTEAERLTYSERVSLYGDVDAMRWLQERLGPGVPQETR